MSVSGWQTGFGVEIGLYLCLVAGTPKRAGVQRLQKQFIAQSLHSITFVCSRRAVSQLDFVMRYFRLDSCKLTFFACCIFSFLAVLNKNYLHELSSIYNQYMLSLSNFNMKAIVNTRKLTRKLEKSLKGKQTKYNYQYGTLSSRSTIP